MASFCTDFLTLFLILSHCLEFNGVITCFFAPIYLLILSACHVGTYNLSLPAYSIKKYSLLQPSTCFEIISIYLPIPWFLCTTYSPGLKYLRSLSGKAFLSDIL